MFTNTILDRFIPSNKRLKCDVVEETGLDLKSY